MVATRDENVWGRMIGHVVAWLILLTLPAGVVVFLLTFFVGGGYRAALRLLGWIGL